MKKDIFDNNMENHWCPGCGNFPILEAIKGALIELEIPIEDFVMVSGIGQAAKTPHFMKINFVNGLHGRSLPVATAIKAVNPKLKVMVDSGDGCMYSEGGNHLIHAIRRNVTVTTLVHNNMVYGLTKGQASPTSQIGFKTPVQITGVINKPFNPIALAISQNCTFVARAFAGDVQQTKEIIKKALLHKGFSLIDIFQPCVSFNKVNTYQWFKEKTYYLDEKYQPNNQIAAFQKALESEKLPLGIFYQKTDESSFEEKLIAYENGNTKPIIERKQNLIKIKERFFN